MNILERIVNETAEHEAALQKRLVELVEERKETKRTLRALARYRKQLGAPPPGLMGLDEPERPLIDAIEAASNGQTGESIDEVNEKLWQAADEFGRGMAEPFDLPPSVDEPIGDDEPEYQRVIVGHPVVQAPEVTEEATPKRRKRRDRSKADA